VECSAFPTNGIIGEIKEPWEGFGPGSFHGWGGTPADEGISPYSPPTQVPGEDSVRIILAFEWA